MPGRRGLRESAQADCNGERGPVTDRDSSYLQLAPIDISEEHPR